MSLVGTWVETKDGRIMEVTRETETAVIGTEIVYRVSKPLRYGNELTVAKNEVIYE